MAKEQRIQKGLQQLNGGEEETTSQGTVGAELGKDSLTEEQSSRETRTTRMMKQIQKYGRLGMEISEIKEKVGVSTGTVSHILRKYGIWNVAKLRKELKQPGAEKRSDASWASSAGVDIEVVRRIREEIKGEETESREEVQGDVVKSKRPYTPRNSSFRERLSISRSGRVQITQESDDIELEAEEASPVITYKSEAPEYPKNEQELAEELGISVSLIRPIKSRLYIYPAVGAIAKEYKVSREIVEKILEIVKREQYDRTHTVVQYKIKMNELRSIVKSEVKDKSKAIALEYQVDILVREFTSFLTQNDYIFLAYGYAKARKYEKAIQFGEEHLGLDTPSIPALEQKIQELLQRGLDDKEKQEVAKTFKIFGGGNEDER